MNTVNHQPPAALSAQANTSPLRLLCLLPFAPQPDATHGGGRVMAQLLIRLARQHRVAVLYLRAPEQPGIDDALAAECDLVEEVPLPDPRPMRPWLRKARVFASVLAGQPLWIGDVAVPAYAERLRALAQAWQPDIVQIEYHLMGQYVAALGRCRAPRVLNQYEPGTQAALDKCRSPLRQGRWLPYVDALAWHRYERRLVRQVQAVVVFTERDRQVMARLSQRAHVVRIPFGEEIPEQPLNPVGSQPPNLLFVGNYAHVPNIEAAVRLAREILPRVQAQVPDIRLYLVGDQAPRLLERLGSSNIVVTGRVSDVLPYLDQATMVVAPLHTGGGMRVKVMQALAAGKAIVASRLAVEGLDLCDGQQVVLAETDEQFSDAILRLLGHPAERVALAGRARAWACAHLSWDASIQAYTRLYTRLMAGAEP
jgi:polysaccharide biosynthesis protein PslH